MKGEFTVQFSPKKSKMAFSWNNLKMGPYNKDRAVRYCHDRAKI